LSDKPIFLTGRRQTSTNRICHLSAERRGPRYQEKGDAERADVHYRSTSRHRGLLLQITT
jgi:hypothetical protein